MFQFQQTPGRTITANGKEHLFFSGYAYLGMHQVAAFVDLVKEGIDRYGFVFPSSRISNTQLDLFEKFEQKLSEITGMENTVCFSSGFLAARAVLDIYRDHQINCAPHTHPALCAGKSNHGSFKEWSSATDSGVIAFDSVNPLTADVNDPGFLTAIDKPITCIIDDSHGAGLLNDGHGVAESVPAKQGIEKIIVYSLSKAYNLIGGAVSCSGDVADKLKQSSFYTASSSLSPALAYAFLHGGDVYEQQRIKLNNNIRRFGELTGNTLKSHPSLPIFVLPADTDVRQLEKQQIIISSFAYPDPAGQQVKRVVLSALHTNEDLERLAESIATT